MIFFLLLSSVAQASEGPWTTAPGLHNVYLGVMGEGFSCFEAEGDQEEPCSRGVPITAPVAMVGVKGFYRTGVSRLTDVALGLPAGVAFSTEPVDSELFDTTLGMGLIEGRVRRRLPSLGPLDLAVGAGLRTGALHRETRGRVTNLGEGSTDLVGTLYAGNSGLFLRSFHTSSVDLSYVLRSPMTSDAQDRRLPGDEIRLSYASTLALSQYLGVGLSLDGSWRLWGETLDMAALSDYGDDRWVALQASQLKAGGRAVLYPSGKRPYLQLSAMRTVWAENNPLDNLLVELAMGFDLGERR